MALNKTHLTWTVDFFALSIKPFVVVKYSVRMVFYFTQKSTPQSAFLRFKDKFC